MAILGKTPKTAPEFTPEQIALAQLSQELASQIELVLNFDRSQLANGGPSHDSFYKLDNSSSRHPPSGPGQVLKVQEFTEPSVYNIPAQTSLSRIIYSTTNLNGTLIPASAAVLWPYAPREFHNANSNHGHSKHNSASPKAPVVLWTHGTSGFYADGSPSAHRSLFYGDIVPFTLAQAGYVVVAPDYAGLGVATSWDGSFVPHQYLASHAGAADALNSLRAVRKIWGASITDDYVVIGHSQGGSISWGVSELLAASSQESGAESANYKDLEDGHLGTIVTNPGTSTIYEGGASAFFPWVGKSLATIFPTFKLSDWLTPLGIARTELLGQIQGGQFVSELLLSNETEIVNPAWNETWYERAASALAIPGRRPFKGPMILFEGTSDRLGRVVTNTALFNETCPKYGGGFELMLVNGTKHFPTIEASRHKWLSWIEDCFEGKPVSKDCVRSELENFLPVERYQVQSKSYQQWAGAPQWLYELPAGT